MITRKQAKREARQLFRFCLAGDLLDESRTRQVVQRTVNAAYRGTPMVLSEFLRLVRLDRAAHTATVESATSLPSELQAALRAGLSRRYGSGLNTEFAERPSLIAGVRIQVGSDVYDGSVLGKLTALEKSF